MNNVIHQKPKGYIQADQFQLHYLIEGKGIPALVIGSATYYPRTFSHNIKEYFQFLFLDHRGFAPVNGPLNTEAYTLDKIINDIELARITLGLDKIALIGHSGHGFMALEYAKKYPNNVSHLILVGMGPSNNHENHSLALQYFEDSVCTQRKKILLTQLDLLQNELKTEPEKAFISYCIRLGARSWYDASFDATSLWEGVEVNMPIMDYLWGEVFRDVDITLNLDKVLCPVFLGLGKYDYLVAPFYTWNTLRNQFKNLTLRLFEQSGHTPQYEEPDVFDQEIIEWINKNPQN